LRAADDGTLFLGGAPVAAFFILYLLSICTLISLSDIRHLAIPDGANVVLAVGGLVLSVTLPPIDVYGSVMGLLAGGVAAWLFKITYRSIRKIEGIGMGDVKFLAAAGTWVGASGLAPLLFIASAGGLCFFLVRRLQGEDLKPTDRVPFGPLLCLGLLAIAVPQMVRQSSIYELLLPSLPRLDHGNGFDWRFEKSSLQGTK